jgi:predicted N-acetyltransferase YhbS
MIRVRVAVPEDAGAIADPLGELGYPTSAAEIPARLRAVAEVPGRVLVALDAEAVIGVASVTRLTLLHRAGPVALLSALVVQPHRRGEGVGFYVGLGFESGSRKFVRPVAV